MIRRLLKSITIITIFFIAIIFLLVGISATETGSRWFISWLIKTNNIPVTIESIDGHLLSNVYISDLHYKNREGTEVTLDRLELDWSASALLGLKVKVNKLYLTDLEYRSGTGKSSEFTIPKLKIPSLPVAVSVNDLNIQNARIIVDEVERGVFNARSRLKYDKNGLSLQLEELLSEKQRFTASVSLTKNRGTEVDVTVNWSGELENEPGRGELAIKGQQNDLSVNLNIDSVFGIWANGNFNLNKAPYAGELNGELIGKLLNSYADYLVFDTALAFKFKGDINHISGGIDSKAHLDSGESFQIKLETDAAIPGKIYERLTVNFNWEIIPDDVDSFFLSLMGQGDFEYADQILTIDHDLQLPVAIDLTGKVNFPNESVDITMSWEDMTIPVTDSDSLRLNNGIIKVVGSLDEILLSLQTRYLMYSNVVESGQQVIFDKLNAEGELNLLAGHPVGQITGVLTMPVPELVKDYSEGLEAITFSVQSGEELIDLSVKSAIRLKGGRLYDLALTGNMDLAASKNPRELFFNWSVDPESEQGPVYQGLGNGKLIFNNDHVLIQHESKAPFVTTLQGDIYLSKIEETRLSLIFNWQNLSFPIGNNRTLLTQQGNINLEGPLSSLLINADGSIQVEPVGLFDFNMAALWSESILTVKTFMAHTLDGKIDINGNVNIQDRTKGILKVEGKGLNIGNINSDLDSQLDVTSIIDFSDESGILSTKVNVSSISGEWRGFPVKGLAEFNYSDEVLRIDRLHLESGHNSIDSKLTLDKLMSGFVDLNIQDLSVFSSELAGEIQGRMEISGRSDAPGVHGKITGKNIYMNDLRMASMIADTQIDLRPQKYSSLTLQLTSLSFNNYLLDEVSITGKGLTGSHKIEIVALGPDLNLVGKLDGGLKDKLWSGRLDQIDLNNKDFGAWQLNKPARLEWHINENAFKLERACLHQDDANACFVSSGELANPISANIDLNRIPLKITEPWLPETLSLNGNVSGNILYKTIDEQWELETSLEGMGIQVRIGYDDNLELLDIESALLNVSFNKSSREMSFKLISQEYFNLALTGSMLNKGDRPLQADLDLGINDIVWLEKFEPALTGSHGKFQAQLTARGTLHKPEIMGDFSLQNGLLSVLPIGLILDQIEGDVKSNDINRQIQLSSILVSGDKLLRLKGHASLNSETGYPYEFDVTGENFPVVRTADITMDISPNLKISGTQELHYIKGKITIPLLEMLLTSLPESAVSVTPDVVIIQSKQPGAVHISDGNGGSDFIKNHLDVDINVLLDPDIHILGFGLDTRLKGDINIVKPVGVYQPRGDGLVTIKEGNYRAYGQNLEIEQGLLQFGGPLDNPGVSVRAFRPNLPVKAGVSISGNVRQPKLTLFSEPVQTETDTLSYLITGRPISGASGGEANLIAQAALTLGARESSILTSQIESMFNLDEFSVGGGETVEGTSLNASKRLSQNLTFRSSFNPFDQLWSFLLNYKLTDHWSVQTESGISQGADIIYSIKSNTFRDLGTRILELLKF